MLYPALAAKAEAAGADFLAPEDWLKQVEAKTREELWAKMSQKPPYSRLNHTGSPEDLERDTDRLAYAELERFSWFICYPAKGFVNRMRERQETEAIKGMLRYKHALFPERPPLPPEGSLNLQKIWEESAGVPDLVASLKHTDYSPALQGALPNYEATGSCSILETALDYAFWHSLRERLPMLSGEEKAAASYYLGVEEDLHNISWIYRAKFLLGLSGEDILPYTLTDGYYLPKETIHLLAQKENKKDFQGLVAQQGYPDLFPAEEPDALDFSLRLCRQRRMKVPAVKQGELGFLLWYYILLTYEINLLIMITEFIALDVETDQRKKILKEMLIWP